MNHTTPTRTLIAAVALFAGASTHALDIDSFLDDPSQVVASQSSGSVSFFSDISTPHALGGSRELLANAGTGAFGTLGIVGDGLLQFANAPRSAGTLSVDYDPMSADLTDAGASDGFLFRIEFADEPVDYSIRVEGQAFDVSFATGTLPTGITGSGDAQDIFIPFTDLIGTADLTTVGSLNFQFAANNGVKGADLSISNLRTGPVPEPSSLALLALGGLAMM